MNEQLIGQQYDTGQISDILLMPDFLERFASCADRTNSATCSFSVVREGLIVALLSIGTLFGALMGAPWVSARSAEFPVADRP